MIVDWWPSIKRRSLTLLKGLGVVGFLAICVGLLIWGSVEWAPKTETTKSVLVWDSLWGIISVSFVGMCVAVFGILWTRSTARQRETLKFIHGYNSETGVRDGLDVIRQVSSTDPNVIKLSVKDAVQFGSQSRRGFLIVLNKFEILAIGLDHQIYEKSMIEDCFGRDIINIFIDSAPLIAHFRKSEKNGGEGDPDAFSQFENLAEEISEDKKCLPKIKNRFETAQKQLEAALVSPL